MGKNLVVFYSAEGHTKEIADQIAKNINADLFEIEPIRPYSPADLEWMNNTSRVFLEHEDTALRDLALKSITVPGWDTYDNVVFCYPIWWGIAAWPVNGFVRGVDWNKKNVYPVATSHSSPLGESDALLREIANGGNWNAGKRFFQSANPDDIKHWCTTTFLENN